MKNNTLSICMIVKNEALNMGACLDSVKSIADEIIVVDTGSTDDTIKIAKEYNCKIFNITWKDDFSFARNVSLENATCDWVLWLDADDRMLKEDAEKIKKLKTAPQDRAFGFYIYNNNKGEKSGTSCLQVRMFPNHRDIRFERKVHEQVVTSIVNAGLQVMYVDVAIIHTGYSDLQTLKNKSVRNLKILRDELAQRPNDPNLLVSIADAFMILDNLKQARNVLISVYNIDNLKELQSDIYAQVPISIANLYLKENNMMEAERFLNEGIKRDKSNISALYLLGELNFIKGNFKISKDFLELVKKTPYTPTSLGIDYNEILIKTENLLGKITEV